MTGQQNLFRLMVDHGALIQNAQGKPGIGLFLQRWQAAEQALRAGGSNWSTSPPPAK